MARDSAAAKNLGITALFIVSLMLGTAPAMLTAATLEIEVTSVTPQRFIKLAGPDAATVSASGDIDVSGVAEAVVLRWTLRPELTRTFNSNQPAPGPITITKPGGDSPPPGLFGTGQLSNGDRTLTVTDANIPDSGLFIYRLHTTVGDIDPSIRNR